MRCDPTDLYSDYWTVEDFDGGKIDVFLCGKCNGGAKYNCPKCAGDGLA